MAAERDSTERYVAAFMKEREGADLRGAHHRRHALRPVRAAEGDRRRRPRAGAHAWDSEFFHHDEKRHALVGDRSGTAYRLGDMFTVRLVEAAPLTGGLRFELTENNEPEALAPPDHVPSRSPSSPSVGVDSF